jgi:hypothetical protein
VTDHVLYGAGAVGGVIGARLHRAGHPVTFVARGEHLARIRADGLLLDTTEGRDAVHPPATDTAADVAWTDDTVVLLTVKSHQTETALEDLRSAGFESVPRPDIVAWKYRKLVTNAVGDVRAVLPDEADVLQGAVRAECEAVLTRAARLVLRFVLFPNETTCARTIFGPRVPDTEARRPRIPRLEQP